MPKAIIPISNYKPFYIQYGNNPTATDTREEWGMIAQVNPYPLMPNPKQCYNNDWKDEDGDDEYNEVMHYEAFEMEVQFYLKAVATTTRSAAAELKTLVDSFFDAVKQGEFKVYDSYTECGFQKVRYAGYSTEEYKSRGNWARVQFIVKFKVNDPTTRMTMNNSSIVAE